MTDPLQNDAIQGLADRQAITDVIHGYGYALDDRDWDALRACFTPDVVGHYGGDPLRGYEAIEELCRTTLEPLSVSQHLIGNVRVTVDGDTAGATCYLHAQHVREGVPGGDQHVIAGCYRDRFARTDDGWRIRERRLERWWTAGNPAVTAR